MDIEKSKKLPAAETSNQSLTQGPSPIPPSPLPPQLPTVGRIVDYFPGEKGIKLPNRMPKAPAIVTQVFGPGQPINLTIFICDNEAITPAVTGWSVPHQSDAKEGHAYWDWPARV